MREKDRLWMRRRGDGSGERERERGGYKNGIIYAGKEKRRI